VIPRDPLSGRRILVLSPDRWGAMHLSKHHYALALAERGNEVLFLQPAEPTPTAPRVERVEGGVRVVTWSGSSSLRLRYHARFVHDALYRRSVGNVLSAIGGPPDVVWCFETNVFSDLRVFRAPVRIYHPVDAVFGPQQRTLARSAQLVLSVAPEILNAIPLGGARGHILNHGLSEEFARFARDRDPEPRRAGPVRVGFIGSLFKEKLAHTAMRRIIEEHPDVEFHIWSPLALSASNVAGLESAPRTQFVRHLGTLANVRLHGLQRPADVARAVQSLDLFLFCDRGNAWNSHKLLEYLSTGKPVVSMPVSRYRGSALIEMTASDDDDEFRALFARSLENLDSLSAPAAQRARMTFALEQTYARQIDRISALLAESLVKSTASA